MSKCVLFVILTLISIKKGFSLECYSSNMTLDKPLDKQVIRHELKDCNQYLEEITRGQNGTKVQISKDKLRCFGVVLTAGRIDIMITGCFPKGGCKHLKNEFQSIVKRGTSTVSCSECDTDRCNNVQSLRKYVSDGSPTSQVISLSTIGVWLITIFIIT